jgi:hypothetical protein
MSDQNADGVPVLLLTMAQVAAMCQVSLDRVRDWTYLPGFPAIRTKHQVRIHAGLLDDWLRKRALGDKAPEETAA